ncbi:MAG: iron-sulfur cluster-binding protein [Magnetovibrio sp.]|nr:iron-sulfur cluster-binding protein [Magnetovibrio sp.]
MESSAHKFKDLAFTARRDAHLQAALGKLGSGFSLKRKEAARRLPEFEGLRDQAKTIKDHVLENLDFYLERFEERVIEGGGELHWCGDADAAQKKILDICRKANAKTVTKSKSMIGEEIAINEFLEKNNIEPIETDLGEYIIQLRGETPSHIIAPAVHLNMGQVEDTFREKHTTLEPGRKLDEPQRLLEEARSQLRDKFLNADVGITGANMLIAETGSTVLVTNEGNADLTHTLPRIHIVIATLEKVVPTLEDATSILRVLARSATGQEMSVYTTFCTGPKKSKDEDGPDEYHVILLDNGRSELLGSEFQDMLRCIRCGACLNHCPVYQTIGGHAYGWVYSGPMGAVLIPALIGLDRAGDLPNASTLCGQCEAVCPMRIPLPGLLRAWRTKQFEGSEKNTLGKILLKVWVTFVKSPKLYRGAMNFILMILEIFGRKSGGFQWLPLAKGWTQSRDFPSPAGPTFVSQWKKGLLMSDQEELQKRQKK